MPDALDLAYEQMAEGFGDDQVLRAVYAQGELPRVAMAIATTDGVPGEREWLTGIAVTRPWQRAHYWGRPSREKERDIARTRAALRRRYQ